jgi:hypothetical protein
MAKQTIRQTYVGSRAIVNIRKGQGTIDVRGSLFCGVRDSAPAPLCVYYAALVSRFMHLYGLQGDVHTGLCRAVGDRSCVLQLSLQ